MKDSVDHYAFKGHPRKAVITASAVISNQSVQIIPENLYRIGLILYNASANTVYITFAPTGNSSDTLCYQIAAYSSWAVPAPVYRGPVSGIRNSGTGKVIATELQEVS